MTTTTIRRLPLSTDAGAIPKKDRPSCRHASDDRHKAARLRSVDGICSEPASFRVSTDGFDVEVCAFCYDLLVDESGLPTAQEVGIAGGEIEIGGEIGKPAEPTTKKLKPRRSNEEG